MLGYHSLYEFFHSDFGTNVLILAAISIMILSMRFWLLFGIKRRHDQYRSHYR